MITVETLSVNFKGKILLLLGGFNLKELGWNTENFRGTQTAWNKFWKPATNVAAPFIDMTVAAISKSQEVVLSTVNRLKLTSRVEVLSLTDMHGNGLRLKVLWT